MKKPENVRALYDADEAVETTLFSRFILAGLDEDVAKKATLLIASLVWLLAAALTEREK